jgi:hypothetical protein
MIETFIRQRITDPEDWFRRIPQYQRSATDPAEKRLYLSRICEIVDRIDGKDLFRAQPTKQQGAPPHTAGVAQTANGGVNTRGYVVADFSAIEVTPKAELFYQREYGSVLRRMVAHVIEVESPVYDNVLVARIARAHGFHRSGGNIKERVLTAVEHRFPRTNEDGRTVFWKETSISNLPVPYRAAPVDVRPHPDIPIAELAGLAAPYVRLRMGEEQILKSMSNEFGLTRLREATRERFARAIMLALSAFDTDPHASRGDDVGARPGSGSSRER